VSERTTVEKREVGFRFHVSVDNEMRTVTSGSKTPDKLLIHASLEGHTDTYEEAVKQAKDAKKACLELTSEKEGENHDETRKTN
jgi:DNA-binding MurR/RpiR family transcriptional regulator